MKTLLIIVVLTSCVSALSQRNITGVRPLGQDLETPEALAHEPEVEIYREPPLWTFYELPYEGVIDVTPEGWILGYTNTHIIRWKPGESVENLSAIPSESGYLAVMNRLGDVVVSIYPTGSETGPDVRYHPLGGGSRSVSVPSFSFSYIFDCEPELPVSETSRPALVEKLDDLGVLWLSQGHVVNSFPCESGQGSVKGLSTHFVGRSLVGSGQVNTPLATSYNVDGVSSTGSYYGRLSREVLVSGGTTNEDVYIWDGKVTGSEFSSSGFQVHHVNSWGVALASNGVHLPDGTVDPLPSGIAEWIDEFGNVRGARLFDASNNLYVKTSWKPARDQEGVFLGYAARDYVSLPLPEGWSSGTTMAPDEVLPQTGVGSSLGATSPFLLMPMWPDLDVDSDNDGIVNRSRREEDLEAPDPLAPEASKPGKVIFVNNGDTDTDGVPDFADGLNLFEDDGIRAPVDSDVSDIGSLTPMILELPDFRDVRVVFHYDASDPSQVLRTTDSYGNYQYDSAPGQLRVWTKDGNELRQVEPIGTDGGDFVGSDILYSREDLGFQEGETVKTFYVESVRPITDVASDRVAMSVWFEQPADNTVEPDYRDEVAFTSLLPSPLIPDYNRDGVIDEYDRNLAEKGQPFYMWINDDDDVDAATGNDIPLSIASAYEEDLAPNDPGSEHELIDAFASETPDSANNIVDGIRDLEDFFPILVDVGSMLDGREIGDLTASVSGIGINIIDPAAVSSAKLNTSGEYLRDVTKADLLKDAPVLVQEENTVQLPESFLQALLDGGGKATLLIEGASSTSDVSQLAVVFKDGDQLVDQFTALLQLSPVEDMFKHINLTEYADSDSLSVSAGGKRYTGYPDRASSIIWSSEMSSKEFVYLHGYNISPQQARGEHSTVFKRLYQMGLQSEFTGVTWFGWASQRFVFNRYRCPDYYNNIINSFKTSPVLKTKLDSLGYDKFAIGAHSMGNVVVSSAIADWGLDPEQFLLFNAAVALEAFGDAPTTESMALMSALSWANNVDQITNDDLSDAYEPHLWASEWHELFTDRRRLLTWRNRFGAIPQAYNFYSGSENVLANSDGNGVSAILDFGEILNGDRAWYSQEVGKGTSLLETVKPIAEVDRHGGWGFSSDSHYKENGEGPKDRQPWNELRANTEISDDDMRKLPFFLEFDEEDDSFALPYDPDGSGSWNFTFKGADFYDDSDPLTLTKVNELEESEFYMARAKLLAEAIPATTYAVGRNPVESFDSPLEGSRNFDMPTLYKSKILGVPAWPTERVNENDLRWKHGDMHRIGLVYIYELYEKINRTGTL